MLIIKCTILPLYMLEMKTKNTNENIDYYTL